MKDVSIGIRVNFRPTEFLNTCYRLACYIKLYRKLFSCMRPVTAPFHSAEGGSYSPGRCGGGGLGKDQLSGLYWGEGWSEIQDTICNDWQI